MRPVTQYPSSMQTMDCPNLAFAERSYVTSLTCWILYGYTFCLFLHILFNPIFSRGHRSQYIYLNAGRQTKALGNQDRLKKSMTGTCGKSCVCRDNACWQFVCLGASANHIFVLCLWVRTLSFISWALWTVWRLCVSEGDNGRAQLLIDCLAI